MADPAFDDFAASFKGQAGEILDKIDTNEAKLDELEQQKGGFFSWIGKNAQSVVIKTLLLKNRGDLHKIYRAAGEKFISDVMEVENAGADTRELAEKTKALNTELQDLVGATALLKEEYRALGEAFSGEGNPSRRMYALERQIAGAQGRLTEMRRRFGAYALDAAWKEYFAPVLTEEDRARGEKINLLEASVNEAETGIEKIGIAMTIDAEKAGIEKMKHSIGSRRRKISEAENEIAGLEKDIAGAEKRIEELEKKSAAL
jgi:peptidoglycan hydrolase CwlO-like protein